MIRALVQLDEPHAMLEHHGQVRSPASAHRREVAAGAPRRDQTSKNGRYRKLALVVPARMYGKKHLAAMQSADQHRLVVKGVLRILRQGLKFDIFS